ncbi:hypothetical protein FNU79_11240 [Deinococcus detaillensis]|uniref:Uncharacterized protein n=1 Tax=Deinococcus detaillensis TaxID=2592048 RepID=A0A553UWE7_9DEIO|nr:hypothetical protein [Deinococcus detaillensis]TSA84525.1 hypothetical protein FNU79_11240 [Deinococcus detaillensis]
MRNTCVTGDLSEHVTRVQRLNTLKLQLKLLALRALLEVERQAIALAQTGIKLVGPAKKAQAKEHIVTKYAQATAAFSAPQIRCKKEAKSVRLP